MARSRNRMLRAQNWPNRIVAPRGAIRNGNPIVPTIAVQAKKATLKASAFAQIIFQSRLQETDRLEPHVIARRWGGAALPDTCRTRSPAAARCHAKPTNVPG